MDITTQHSSTMASLVARTPVKLKKRVSFAYDEPELLMKPKPSTVAVYVVNSAVLVESIKTYCEIEAEELALFRELKISKKAWKPTKYTNYEEQFLSEDDDLNDAVWELFQMALDADKL